MKKSRKRFKTGQKIHETKREIRSTEEKIRYHANEHSKIVAEVLPRKIPDKEQDIEVLKTQTANHRTEEEAVQEIGSEADTAQREATERMLSKRVRKDL